MRVGLVDGNLLDGHGSAEGHHELFVPGGQCVACNGVRRQAARTALVGVARSVRRVPDARVPAGRSNLLERDCAAVRRRIEVARREHRRTEVARGPRRSVLGWMARPANGFSLRPVRLRRGVLRVKRRVCSRFGGRSRSGRMVRRCPRRARAGRGEPREDVRRPRGARRAGHGQKTTA